MPRPAVLICAALQLEANAIAAALNLSFDSSRMSASGTFATDRPIELRLVGISALRLRDAKPPADIALVISAGVAGALDPSLHCGDVILDGSCESFTAPALPFVRLGRVHHSSAIVTSPSQKAELFTKTGALAVDMESGPIAAWASAAGIPFLALRAISDTAAEAIDPRVLGLIDPLGRPRTGAAIATLLRHPLLLGQLLRLRTNSNLACARVGQALRALLE